MVISSGRQSWFVALDCLTEAETSRLNEALEEIDEESGMLVKVRKSTRSVPAGWYPGTLVAVGSRDWARHRREKPSMTALGALWTAALVSGVDLSKLAWLKGKK